MIKFARSSTVLRTTHGRSVCLCLPIRVQKLSLLSKVEVLPALVRRCVAYERIHNTEAALADAQAALRLEPSNAALARLQKLEDERMGKLKTEKLAKLKDLGKSILGNFGLSLAR
jgi:hypothetical protein